MKQGVLPGVGRSMWVVARRAVDSGPNRVLSQNGSAQVRRVRIMARAIRRHRRLPPFRIPNSLVTLVSSTAWFLWRFGFSHFTTYVWVRGEVSLPTSAPRRRTKTNLWKPESHPWSELDLGRSIGRTTAPAEQTPARWHTAIAA